MRRVPFTLEIAESIDMLRFIESGISVHMVETDFDTRAVDRPNDLAEVELLLNDDPLVSEY